MNLFKRIAKEENENLKEKIIETIKKAKNELRPYLEIDAITARQEISKNDTTEKEIFEITSNENLVDDYIETADIAEAYALKVNLNSTEVSDNLKAYTKQFFSDAIRSAVSSLKGAKNSIKDENYADALEHVIKVNKAIGCLEAAEKLDLIKKLLTTETQKKVDAAHASHLLKPEAKSIVLSLAEKQCGSFRTREELFKLIGYACHSEIKKQFPEKTIRGDAFNFAQILIKHASFDKEFGERIDLLIKKRNESANLQSVWSNVNSER